jgi:hypothetical protein
MVTPVKIFYSKRQEIMATPFVLAGLGYSPGTHFHGLRSDTQMTIQKPRPLARIFESLVRQTRPVSPMSFAAAFWRRYYGHGPRHDRGMPLEALDDRLLEDIGAPIRRSGRFSATTFRHEDGPWLNARKS